MWEPFVSPRGCLGLLYNEQPTFSQSFGVTKVTLLLSIILCSFKVIA
jgi:hypothetical protein